MSIGGSLKDLNVSALLRLKEIGLGESTTLDYKRALPDGSGQGSREFLKDVSAMANTEGGDLVFGAVEQDGLLIDIPGVEVSDPDAEQNRLEQMAVGDGVEPRIPGLQFARIEITKGRFVFVVRVPQSWIGPHRVSFQGGAHFYGRGATTTFAMNVQQLRDAFTAAGTRAQRMREFRQDRVRSILGSRTPVRLTQTDVAAPLAIVHILPVQAFAGRPQDLIQQHAQKLREFNPIGYGVADGTARVNLDGLVNYVPRQHDPPICRAYTQVFRYGCIESVRVLDLNQLSEQLKMLLPFEGSIRTAVIQHVALLRELGMAGPIYVGLTLANIEGCRLFFDRYRQSAEDFDRDIIEIPEVELAANAAPDEALRPMFDMLWNAVGHERCPRFDDSGKWVG